MSISGCLPSITRANTADSAFHENAQPSNGTAHNTPIKRTDEDFYILRKYDEKSSGKFEMAEIKTAPVSTNLNTLKIIYNEISYSEVLFVTSNSNSAGQSTF